MSLSRLSALASKPTLVEYAQGTAQQNVSPVADFLAPTVNVAKPVGYYKVYTEKSRFRIPDTRRALGGRAAEITWDKSDATYNCEPNALDVPVDIVEGDAEDSMESALKEAADLGAEVGSLAHEKRTVDLAVTTLTGGLSNIDFGAATDVIDQIDQQIIAIIKAARYGSLMGVGILLGPTFLRRLKNHASVKGRFTIGKKDYINPSLDDILALFIGAPQGRLSAMVYDNAAEGKAADINFVLDSQAIVFARLENPTRRDPSFMKTFRLNSKWMAPRVYQRDDGRTETAALDWSECPVVTNAPAGQLLGITN